MGGGLNWPPVGQGSLVMDRSISLRNKSSGPLLEQFAMHCLEECYMRPACGETFVDTSFCRKEILTRVKFICLVCIFALQVNTCKMDFEFKAVLGLSTMLCLHGITP